jgi:transposase-like protein
METHRRKADGRRVFTPQFMQEQVARLDRQELTVAELAREVSVSPQLIRHVLADSSTRASRTPIPLNGCCPFYT